jgi:type I restriction-modification system DNA methylase subunit
MDNIEQLERRLWSAADQLRANAKLTSTEYYIPVLGLIFLRHAYNRFIVVEAEVEAGQPSLDYRFVRGRLSVAGQDDASEPPPYRHLQKLSGDYRPLQLLKGL